MFSRLPSKGERCILHRKTTTVMHAQQRYTFVVHNTQTFVLQQYKPWYLRNIRHIRITDPQHYPDNGRIQRLSDGGLRMYTYPILPPPHYIDIIIPGCFECLRYTSLVASPTVGLRDEIIANLVPLRRSHFLLATLIL